MARESILFAVGGGQVMRRRCLTATTIVFPPIILSKLIYDRLFGRWTVGEASWCACAQVCAVPRAARACLHCHRNSYLQMVHGYVEQSSALATQHPRKLRNVGRALFFILCIAEITQKILYLLANRRLAKRRCLR